MSHSLVHVHQFSIRLITSTFHAIAENLLFFVLLFSLMTSIIIIIVTTSDQSKTMYSGRMFNLINVLHNRLCVYLISYKSKVIYWTTFDYYNHAKSFLFGRKGLLKIMKLK